MFALLLGVHAAWTLAAELVRPPRPAFPAAATAAPATQEERDRAVSAATLGAVRADLWADDAILLAGGLRGSTHA